MSRLKTREARSSPAGDQIGPRLLGKPVAGKLPNPGVATLYTWMEYASSWQLSYRDALPVHVACRYLVGGTSDDPACSNDSDGYERGICRHARPGL